MFSKPLLIYIDDEPHNLTVFEAAFSDDVDIRIYDNPLKALDEITKLEPWIVASDQRMPGMNGVNFLEIIKRTHPNAKRILITGYSDEDLVIQSVRKAQVHDYIRKPWDVDDLNHRIHKMIETYLLENELKLKTESLEKKNQELLALTKDLKFAKENEEVLRKEVESWAPPFILKMKKDDIQYPIKKDLALITFDIIKSSQLHGVYVNNKLVRSQVLKAFSEIVIKHGGWPESHSGDSSYAHIGLVNIIERPAQAIFSISSEFRIFLRNFSNFHNINIECGIGLHMAKDCVVDLHVVEIESPFGRIVQKSFDTTSTEIDLVHRLESITHCLPGTNIAMTEIFIRSLGSVPVLTKEVGSLVFKGQEKPVNVFIKLSDKVTDSIFDEYKANLLIKYSESNVSDISNVSSVSGEVTSSNGYVESNNSSISNKSITTKTNKAA